MVMGRNGHGPKRLWAEMTWNLLEYEPRREKTNIMHMRKQRREADQCLCFRKMESTIPLLSKSEISVV